METVFPYYVQQSSAHDQQIECFSKGHRVFHHLRVSTKRNDFQKRECTPFRALSIVLPSENMNPNVKHTESILI